MEVLLVKTACPSRAEAYAIARDLVDKQLVAAVQVNQIYSFYWWQNQKHEKREWELSCFAAENCWNNIEKRIYELHSYELPEVVALKIDRITPAYKQWVFKYSRK